MSNKVYIQKQLIQSVLCSNNYSDEESDSFSATELLRIVLRFPLHGLRPWFALRFFHFSFPDLLFFDYLEVVDSSTWCCTVWFISFFICDIFNDDACWSDLITNINGSIMLFFIWPENNENIIMIQITQNNFLPIIIYYLIKNYLIN